MTEQPPAHLGETGPDPEPPHPSSGVGTPAVATGVPAVDAVLAELEGVRDLPLDEQLRTFEGAHETLRAALDPDTSTLA